MNNHNNSRMAASNVWREGYWRNVSFLQGLLCAAEVIIELFFFEPTTCILHCAQFKRGPKIFRKGTKRGPDFEQKGDLKGTKRGPKKGTQNSGCSKNQKEITS